MAKRRSPLATIMSSAAIIVPIALLACGCAAPVAAPRPTNEVTMELDAARTELEGILDSAKDSIPGEWTVRSDGVVACRADGGSLGSAQLLSFDGPAPTDPAAAIETVTAIWAAQGFIGEPGQVPDGSARVQYRDPESRLYLEFVARPDRTSVLGESRCVPTETVESG